MPSARTELRFKPDHKLHGFRVTKATALAGLRAAAYELEHEKTGARLLHIHSSDAENLFAIAFRTPPADDTGLPHILEHSVLGGSKKFPVKDPFVEMIKMSMATFINAMTYPDKTVYPVASNVRQDFFNLAEVYCDAVFCPNITENTFKQEGYHYELADKNDPHSNLIIKGIVYNEMKGAYSGPDSLLQRYLRTSLFTDTAYGKDSGGDPERIPDLKYSDFVRFHQDLYHPSNSYIFIYGDIPTEEHLLFLKDKLDAFSRCKVNTQIGRQPRWSQPHARTEYYPIGKDEPLNERTYVTLHWIAGVGTDPAEVLAFTILDRILLGNEAAPLKKAIIDSKLGADLTHSGFSPGTLETTYHIGVKGSESERCEAFEKLVLETLRKIADGGITREMVDAAFQQVAYRYREIQSMYPLWLMDRAYSAWIYGSDPLIFLRADEYLSDLRRRYDTDPTLFGKLIHERLLSNPHRLTLVLKPDREIQTKKEARFTEEMARKKAQLGAPELEKIVREQIELEKLQSAANSPEALATLPQLKVSDLPRKPKHIPTTLEKISGIEVLRNDVFANGVNYLEVDVNLEGLAPELYAYLPLYGDCIRKMGAAGQDYIQTAQRVAACSAGVGFSSTASSHFSNAQQTLTRARFSMKTLDEKADQALAVLRDLILEVDFRDTARLRDVLIQSKAWHRSSLANRGLNLAVSHAGRGFSTEAAVAEILGGVPQVHLILQLADSYDSQREGLVAKLEAIRDFFRNRRRFTVSFTGSESVYGKLTGALKRWAAEMRDEEVRPGALPFTAFATPPREGLATPTDIAYCAQVLPGPHWSSPDAPLLDVASHWLSLSYMWEEVRVKGGAYGGGCGLDASHRTWYFYSYRDPAVNKTLNTFQRLGEYVKAAEWTQTEIERAIIGTAKDGERPIRPGEATGAALWRHVSGQTRELREQWHAGVLAATPKELKRAVLEVLQTNAARAAVCVFSSREKLEAANQENPAAPLAIEDILKQR